MKPLAILLDTGPLSLVTAPIGSRNGDQCKQWYELLEVNGCRFYVPEVADYELRRELLRAHKNESIHRLDQFNAADPERYLPINTEGVQLAAQLWANERNSNRGGASPEALDADVLIAAQALRLVDDPFLVGDVVVATTNKKHLTILTTAETWHEIQPAER